MFGSNSCDISKLHEKKTSVTHLRFIIMIYISTPNFMASIRTNSTRWWLFNCSKMPNSLLCPTACPCRCYPWQHVAKKNCIKRSRVCAQSLISFRWLSVDLRVLGSNWLHVSFCGGGLSGFGKPSFLDRKLHMICFYLFPGRGWIC